MREELDYKGYEFHLYLSKFGLGIQIISYKILYFIFLNISLHLNHPGVGLICIGENNLILCYIFKSMIFPLELLFYRCAIDNPCTSHFVVSVRVCIDGGHHPVYQWALCAL